MSGRCTRSSPAVVMTALAAMTVASTACELSEVVLAEVDDLVVAEVVVQVREDRPLGESAVTALLHRTSGSAEGVRNARILIHRSQGNIELFPAPLQVCAWSSPEDYGTTCYRSSGAISFSPGQALEIEIELPGGGRLEGSTRVPGDFQLHGTFGAHAARPCLLAPESTFELRWSRSEGAWAYVAETALESFRSGLAARGIDVPVDYLYLLGLATSAADTTIVFPSEFGLIERLNTDRDLLVALQRGLPAGAFGRVSIAAVERNYTNWARGGTFNPSGQVRIPSLRGDGTGFFGAVVVRSMLVVVPPSPLEREVQIPPCR